MAALKAVIDASVMVSVVSTQQIIARELKN